MGLRKVTIDKTSQIEEMLPDHLVVCLSGMPGMGRKTAVRVLLEKHPEVNAVFCSVEEIGDGSAAGRRESGRPNWYLVRKPEGCRYPESNEGLWKFVRNMPKEDRILIAVDGLVPENFLELVWGGVMAVVMPETFWFTEAETYRYLKECRSGLRYREVYYLTGGWAGCIAMMVRLEKQLSDRWTARELSCRYEIRKYIRQQILDTLPEDERRLLNERAAFPRLNEELVSILWEDPEKELEERLFVRGAMVYVPETDTWHVQPALRIAMEEYTSPDLCAKAIAWYEEKGSIQDALTCCWYLHDRESYRQCLIRSYDQIPFLNYERGGDAGRDRHVPELLYLEWMEYFIRQDAAGMADIRQQLGKLAKETAEEGVDPDKIREIYLNITYADPKLSTADWMDLLREKTVPGRQVRLYFMLGESVSYLSGIRDLSELFSCGKSQRLEYRKLWKERLQAVNQMPYRLAELEYEFQTDGPLMKKSTGKLEALPEIHRNLPWQERIGMMYLAYLAADGRERSDTIQAYIHRLAEMLEKEESAVCRWNARALLYLAEAKWGEKEGLMKWIRETGGDIENEAGKTKFYMAAEVKINLYLGNYRRAEDLLQTLVPYFENNGNWRWLSESLFQRAILEREKGESGQALKTVAESLAVANPYRYVRLYTGYGSRGAELLEEYRDWLEKKEASGYQSKKKYKYGSVLRMPVPDWVGYIVRKAGRQKKYYPDLQTEQQDLYRAEKLTVTEQMVLQYLGKGCSNAEISEIMNIKLPTVKTHIYNIYKKLGVKTRIQAVQKARELEII